MYRAGERPVSVLAVPALHALTTSDQYTDSRFLGYVLETPQANVYHAGDTIPTDTLIAALRDIRVDVCLLPINGRDWFRERDGVVGNMDAGEAVALTVELGARLLVPTHWDGFAGNTVDPETVVAEARRADAPVHVAILHRLLPFDLP